MKFFIMMMSIGMAWSSCLPVKEKLSGQFRFSHYNPTFLYIRESIDMRWANAKQRKEILEDNNFICATENNVIYECKRIETYQKFSELSQFVHEQYKNNPVYFDEKRESVSLLNKAPTLVEWRVKQDVVVGESEYEEYRYYHLKGIDKVFLKGSWLYIESCSKVFKIGSYAVKRQSQVWEFTFETVFQKN